MRPLLITLTALLFYSSGLAQAKTANLHFNLLSIKDGMPEGRVFPTKPPKEDTGLGLSLSYDIIKHMAVS